MSSGKCQTPEYTELSAAVVRDMNGQTDSKVLVYDRQSVIRTGMTLNVTEVWEERKLTEVLQVIIAKIATTSNGRRWIL